MQDCKICFISCLVFFFYFFVTLNWKRRKVKINQGLRLILCNFCTPWGTLNKESRVEVSGMERAGPERWPPLCAKLIKLSPVEISQQNTGKHRKRRVLLFLRPPDERPRTAPAFVFNNIINVADSYTSWQHLPWLALTWRWQRERRPTPTRRAAAGIKAKLKRWSDFYGVLNVQHLAKASLRNLCRLSIGVGGLGGWWQCISSHN